MQQMDYTILRSRQPVITGWPAFAGHDTPRGWCGVGRAADFATSSMMKKDIYESRSPDKRAARNPGTALPYASAAAGFRRIKSGLHARTSMMKRTSMNADAL